MTLSLCEKEVPWREIWERPEAFKARLSIIITLLAIR